MNIKIILYIYIYYIYIIHFIKKTNRSIKNFLNFRTDFPELYKKSLKFDPENNNYVFTYEEDNFKNALLVSVFSFGCVIGTLIIPLICGMVFTLININY